MTPEERLDRIEQQIEKQNKGIQDLIRVSGTLVTSVQGTVTAIQEMRQAHDTDHTKAMAEIDKLREAQAETDQKLNILIDTIDRMIRHRNGQGEA